MTEQIDIDNHKLMYHPERVVKWKETGDCSPIYVEIGLTNRCNHKCLFCALDWIARDKADISKEVVLSTLEDMIKCGVKSVMFAGEGEPLLHKDAGLFVQKAKSLGMDVSITTNGTLFNKEKAERILPYLSWLRFSIDASKAETYSKVHGTKKEEFNKVIENIKNASELKKELKLETAIGAQFLLISENVNEAIEFAKLAKNSGADNIQIKPYSHHPSSKNDFSVNYSEIGWLETELEKLNDKNFRVLYRKRTMKRLEEGRDYKECLGLSFFALIDANGNVLPCNLFYNSPDFVYGNLYKKSFSKIWQGNERKQVIEKIKARGIEECRVGCRLDAINRYLNRLKKPNAHDNFI